MSSRPKSTIAIQEWVDRLELNVRQRSLEEQRHIRKIAMEKSLERAHEFDHVFRRCWDESGVAATGAADPVLSGTELARKLVAPAAVREQESVNLANETQREWESLLQPRRPWFMAAT
jgi:hypothetical protein